MSSSIEISAKQYEIQGNVYDAKIIVKTNEMTRLDLNGLSDEQLKEALMTVDFDQLMDFISSNYDEEFKSYINDLED